MEESQISQRTSQRGGKAPVLASETLRLPASDGAASFPASSEERLSAFWRIFGGTLLSITALVIITICQHFNNSQSELRGDLSHLGDDVHKDINRLNQEFGDLMKKDEFTSRMKTVWENLKELQDERTVTTALKERVTILDERVKQQEGERKELARELQHLRELKAIEDDRKELVRELQRLRERLAAIEGKQAGGTGVKTVGHVE
jgi:hypothetical protein